MKWLGRWHFEAWCSRASPVWECRGIFFSLNHFLPFLQVAPAFSSTGGGCWNNSCFAKSPSSPYSYSYLMWIGMCEGGCWRMSNDGQQSLSHGVALLEEDEETTRARWCYLFLFEWVHMSVRLNTPSLRFYVSSLVSNWMCSFLSLLKCSQTQLSAFLYLPLGLIYQSFFIVFRGGNFNPFRGPICPPLSVSRRESGFSGFFDGETLSLPAMGPMHRLSSVWPMWFITTLCFTSAQ